MISFGLVVLALLVACLGIAIFYDREEMTTKKH